MRHLFPIWVFLTPIMLMAQAGEPQFVLAVPDGSGYLSPGADGELIVSQTPRGTFVMRDAAAGAIGTLPKSPQLIQLFSKGGDSVRAVVARSGSRVGTASGGPGLPIQVHGIVVAGAGKPRLATGALQDGSLIALTAEGRRRFTRGGGGVITLEPAKADEVIEKTQYFRLELRTAEKAAPALSALDEHRRRNANLSQPNNLDATKVEVKKGSQPLVDPPPDPSDPPEE